MEGYCANARLTYKNGNQAGKENIDSKSFTVAAKAKQILSLDRDGHYLAFKSIWFAHKLLRNLPCMPQGDCGNGQQDSLAQAGDRRQPQRWQGGEAERDPGMR